MGIKNIIANRLKAHVEETENTQAELDKLKTKKQDIEIARNIMILKDKMLFHKACSMELSALLEEIEELK